MDTTAAFVCIVIAILATVIFLRWQDLANKFEENESKKELLEIFKSGFRDGINSNGDVLDSTLKRLGYTMPEQVGSITDEIPDEKPETGEPTYVPLHELEFDLEEAAERDSAQWAQTVQLPEEN